VRIDSIIDATDANQLTLLKMIAVFQSLTNVSPGVVLIFTGELTFCKDPWTNFCNNVGKFLVPVFILLDMVLVSLVTQRNGCLKGRLPAVLCMDIWHSICCHRKSWRLLSRPLFLFWTGGNDEHQKVASEYLIVYCYFCAPSLL
jgi:hypothetical protein